MDQEPSDDVAVYPRVFKVRRGGDRSVGAFPDRDSALRLFTAVAVQTTDVRGTRRYVEMTLPDQKKRPTTASPRSCREEPSPSPP